ncbi:MAG TPA: hypothetical protein VGM84_24740 [Steroidobacteraceae bacterium]|jgi:hypothetical protein
MARSSFTIAVAAWLICLPPGIGANEATAAPDVASPAGTTATAPARPDEQLDEIIVQGSRLWQMRKAITDADDRFFARYNEINKNHDFDVHCGMEAPLGTRLKQRICRAAFQEKADEEWARALLNGTAANPPEVVRVARDDEYRKNLLDVVRGNPELMKLLRQRDALEKKYEAELKKRMKGKWILFE